MIRNELRTGPWNLADLKNVKPNGMKVFSCFCCGGGSTMGYKLAGYEVLGGVEIDPEIANIYRANHNPKHFYRMGVGDFNQIPNEKLPKELFNLDILDGSPPCSSFSMAGSREKKWGVKKKFREGQTEQVLDDLFFDFIATAKKLNPKVVLAENVKGLIQGNARGYVKQIFKGFKDAGYSCQLFLLNAAAMGVPQRRERTFFIANRLGKKISLEFNGKQIPFRLIDEGEKAKRKSVNPSVKGAGLWCLQRNTSEIVNWAKYKFKKEKYFTLKMALPNEPVKTQTATIRHIYPGSDYYLSDLEVKRAQSYPEDYKNGNVDIGYLCGMSVPPFMTQRIADQIYCQLLYEAKS